MSILVAYYSRTDITKKVADEIAGRLNADSEEIISEVKYDGKITYEVANFALDLLEVDKYGLDMSDRQILLTIIEKFEGGPVGLDTLAAAIGEDSGTIEDVYEPYLVKNGFINRTPKGRVATDLAFNHFGIVRSE